MRHRFPALLVLVTFTLLFADSLHAQDLKALVRGSKLPADAMWLESVGLGTIDQAWSTPKIGKSVDGNPLKLGGITFPHGIGTHATSEMLVDLKGAARRFVAMVGVDDESKSLGSVRFEVHLDGKLAAKTPILKGDSKPYLLSVDLTGARQMILIVDEADGNNHSDHADWAGALLLLVPGAKAKPVAMVAPPEDPPAIAMGTAPEPRINGARIVGATPGNPFLFLIPATGQGPLTYQAEGLPEGLTLAAKSGIITGSLRKKGRWRVKLTVSGPKGTARRDLIIVGGKHKLALTPPMGWNSWNVWACSVDDRKVRQAADFMVKTGLAAHGYTYINIDDCWEGKRDSQGVLQPNSKFPNMKALADYVHSKGLKLGIYSSPGPKTCAQFEGSYKFEEIDARTWAKWGIDYLKHDWCSYSKIAKNREIVELMKPYFVMRKALDKCGRDIVYSLCQYGMGNVSAWGAWVGGNCWRTTGDIVDTWSSLSRIGFGQAGLEKYAAPGKWNDPDMMVVGWVGWGPRIHPTRLTPNEQLTHVSLWSLLAAPLLLGCDMTKLDEFTLALLTNDEVIDVNQDPLGRQAGRVHQEGKLEVWARPLHDGSLAVGLFNRGRTGAKITATWATLGLQGPRRVRDLWTHMELGMKEGALTLDVPRHGAKLLKLIPPTRGAKPP